MNGKGAIWVLSAVLCAAGCGQQAAEPTAALAEAGKPGAQVSGESALEEVRRFVALGPKEPGTAGAERAAAHLVARLREIGVEAEIQEFRDQTPVGERTFRNVLGRIPGAGGGILLLGSHYDTKTGIEGFEGANDSGSSTGLLIELARVLKRNGPHPLEIRFAFFDGEECWVEYGPGDGFHGSEHLAAAMEVDGSLRRIAAMILLDMVGDGDLTITIPRNGTPGLIALAFEAARAEGVRKHFSLYPGHIRDDHMAFFRRGVPAVNLIDFCYGSAPGKNDYWHTAEDSMDKLSAESLEIVGRVAARMVEELLRREAAAEK
ncbi:MAG: M28 family peptidase [Opitutae bacterium]|nr:M28 family peptidase [Opitutae bacterium]